MKKVFCVTITMLMFLLTICPNSFGAGGAKSTTAKLCASCHEPESGVMMGFLDNISLKSKIIQMDIMSHKEVVGFTDKTKVKYVTDFADIRNYKTKGFQVNFHEENGEKIADEVIRFDILKAIEEDEKITREEFIKLRQNPQVMVYDVRPPVKYQMAHIPNAIMMPAPAFDKFIGKLPQDKNTPIIFYGVGGCLSPTAAFKTKSLGYNDVKIYIGGYPDWIRSGAYGITESGWLQKAIDSGTPHILIDLREQEEITKGHITGAVAIKTDQLAAKKEMFPPHKKAPIILYGPEAEKAAGEIRSWGYKFVQILNSSYPEWKASGKSYQAGSGLSKIAYQPKQAPGTISLAEFKSLAQKQPSNVTLIDVRNPDELDEGTIQGAVNVPADRIEKEIKKLPENKEIVLFCNTGVRAGMAYTALSNSGIKCRYLNATIAFNDNSFTIEE